MKQKKLIALLSAAVMGMTACLSSGLPSAAEDVSAPVQESVSLEDIYALRSFLLGNGYAEDCQILDMDRNGVLDARDLTLAKRAYLNADRLSNLRADIPNILLNEEENVTFTVSANRPGLSKTVALYDGVNDEPAAYMHDDGKDGDETPNDGIYSAQLKLSSDDFKNVDYYAAAGACKSDPFRICFYRELTQDEFAGYCNLMKQFDGIETFAEAVEIVKNAADITEYIINEGHETVSFDTVYHICGCWETPYEEDDLLGIGKHAVDKEYPIIKFRIPANDAIEVLPDCLITPAHPEKKKVIALIPYQSAGLSGEEIVGVGSALAMGLNTSVTTRYDGEVSINQLKSLAEYGTVLWFGHGSYVDLPGDSVNHDVPVLLTGEKMNYDDYYNDEETYVNHKELSADFSSGRIATMDGRVIVCQDFFDYYYPQGSLNDSLWFLGACCSMTGPELGDVLVQKGAGSVFGFSEPTKGYYLMNVCFEAILNNLLLSASTAKEALDESLRIYPRSLPIKKDRWDDGDRLGAYLMQKGDPNFRLVDKIEDAVPEGGFEDDPDFVADNELVYTLYKDENGTETYRVHGKAGNVNVVVPSSYKGMPVVGFDGNGFKNIKHLRNVYLPDSFTELPDYAFSGCRGLEQIHLPSSLKKIGQYAFEGCPKLKDIQLPNGLTSIGSHAFVQCSELSEIIIPPTVSFIGDNAFNSSGLESVTLNCQPLEELNGTFYNCQKLESASLVSPVEELYATFDMCPVLSHVDLPQGLKTIGNRTFYNCCQMKQIDIPDGVEAVEQEAFSECWALETITLPDSVTTLGPKTFLRCNKLKKAVLSEGMKSTGNSVFYSCEALTDVQLPAHLEEIGAMAFAYCHALEHIEIPDSVKVIGMQAFYDCVKLTITELPPNIEEIYSNAFYRCRFPSMVFKHATFSYVLLPASMKKLNLLAFENCGLSGLVVCNPDMEFAEPTSNEAAYYKILASQLYLYGYEGSTTQAFTEDTSHPGKFLPIEEFFAYASEPA